MSNWQDFSNTGHRIGLGLIASAGLVSAISTLSLLSYIGWNVLSASDKWKPFSRGLRTFTLSSLGWYLLSLLLCDFFQGVAFALNFRWAQKGMMEQGKICMIQGVVSQIGDLGAAIWSMAIAFHTFWLLFLIKQPHRLTVPIVLVIGWSILIFLPILGPTIIETSTRGPFYGLSGAWCWIGNGYGAERVIYLYGWVFAALGSSFIIYTLVYLRFSGFIAFDDAGKMQLRTRRAPRESAFSYPILSPTETSSPSSKSRESQGFPWHKVTRGKYAASDHHGHIREPVSESFLSSPNTQLKRVARRIMWYPLLYAVVVIPVSICRMGALGGWMPPFDLLVFAGICFASSGLSNVILFLTTRKSFITQTNKAPLAGVRVTTQQVTIRDHSTSIDRGIELSPSKFSRTHLVSPTTERSPVILYNGPSRHDFDGHKEKVLIIDHGHKVEDTDTSSN
ncbi:hypothetical protein JB92DRAFT_2943073 [Gautieria morchelliformis]|nr:hypothetical protein JB92DRAFT_2943073 [Gautieria morchelliformis]